MLTLTEFIEERHMIYVKRQMGQPAPWTDDQTLQRFFFTNIYRQLDKTSQVLIRIMTPNTLTCTFLGNVMIHRMLSQPDFCRELRFILNYEDFERLYKSWRAQGKRPRTLAFAYCHSEKKFFHDTRFFWDNSCALMKRIMEEGGDVKAAFNVLIEQPGMGRFLAWQLALDLEMYGAIADSPDFVVLGPGATCGLKYCHFGPELKTHAQQFWFLLGEVNADKPEWLPELRARDLEHALCEYGKYVKWSQNKGKKRFYGKDGKEVHAVREKK